MINILQIRFEVKILNYLNEQFYTFTLSDSYASRGQKYITSDSQQELST